MEHPDHPILRSINLAGMSATERMGMEDFALATGFASLEELLIAFADSPSMQEHELHTLPKPAIKTLFLAFIEDLCEEHGVGAGTQDEPLNLDLLSDDSTIGHKIAHALGHRSVEELRAAIVEDVRERKEGGEPSETVFQTLERMAHARRVDLHLLLFGESHEAQEPGFTFDLPTEWVPEQDDSEEDAA